MFLGPLNHPGSLNYPPFRPINPGESTAGFSLAIKKGWEKKKKRVEIIPFIIEGNHSEGRIASGK